MKRRTEMQKRFETVWKTMGVSGGDGWKSRTEDGAEYLDFKVNFAFLIFAEDWEAGRAQLLGY